ncbi:smc n terminal domain-containing protein, partial [Cystoisospora suis]
GGEKTLSSLSLVFALHHYSPTCVYFLDEIDAALDYRNVSILANFVKQKAKDAQFIIISLRNQLFELANRLVGIYKTHDITKSVAIDPERFPLLPLLPPPPPSSSSSPSLLLSSSSSLSMNEVSTLTQRQTQQKPPQREEEEGKTAPISLPLLSSTVAT